MNITLLEFHHSESTIFPNFTFHIFTFSGELLPSILWNFHGNVVSLPSKQVRQKDII